MKKTAQLALCLLLGIAVVQFSYAQKADSSKPTKDDKPHKYFIITAGEKIDAFYNDRPLKVSTIEEFDTYIQANAKTMKDVFVVVTGKPKTGTFDAVIKTLKRNRFKNIETNIKE